MRVLPFDSGEFPVTEVFARLLWPTRWLIAVLTFAVSPVQAADAPPPGTIVIKSSHGYDTLVTRLEKAITDHKMGLIAQASASRGAAARGVKIPGNAVLMVFRNDYAVRMLQASVAAGIEAPLRFYVTENSDGSATLAYRLPSAVFVPYGNRDLDLLAKELDAVFQKIARDAVGG